MRANNPAQYAPIARHIRHYQLERSVAVAETVASFIAACWEAALQPPAPAPILIDRRREARDIERLVRFAPR
ncbi:MAG TPA: hypothetical protein VFK48_08995 [Usitatibacter sp.]|nr:hypothetical protein [Usitatibacter sp.]